MNLEEYLLKYGEFYPSLAVSYILEHYGNDLNMERPDLMNQVYDALGIFSNDKNPYIQYSNLIEKYFNLNSNILEIGGGFYPALASHIADKQLNLKNGTITVYDKNLILTSLKNIKLVKRDYATEDDVSNFDLLIGIMPCQATSLIIEKANKGKKDFFIALCGCTHFSREYLMFRNLTQNDWFDYIRKLYYKTNIDGTALIEIESPTEYNRYPILIKKIKK